MDKTYNELMDIVNRTKKFDNNDKNMPDPQGRQGYQEKLTMSMMIL